MFRGFVEPTLQMVLKSLLCMNSSLLEVHICLGKLLSALITSVGPELQDTSSSVVTSKSQQYEIGSTFQKEYLYTFLLFSLVRNAFTNACAVLGQPSNHSTLRAESIAGLQQLHMFAPSAVNLTVLVPVLCENLSSPHWILRRSSVSCLRQFAQREAGTMCEIAATLDTGVDSNSVFDDFGAATSEIGKLTLSRQFGLPCLLFSLLDHELDPHLTSDIHDAVTSMMHSTAVSTLSSWLAMCREVLTVATEENTTANDGIKIKDDEFDDASAGILGGNEKDKQSNIQPRWRTRVFAAICLRRIIEDCCQGNRAHFDLSLAREIQRGGEGEGSAKKSDFLVLYLSELIRVAFMAATSDSDPLRLEGLRTLEVIIERFGETQDPEFPGHVILEQYQAQVSAALRPAFATDTPSHITAAACDVCSAWIGSGVARDLGDLRRVYQLLVTSLTKLKPRLNSQSQRHVIFNESAMTLEKLSILKAWAEVYIVSKKNDIQVKTTFDSSLVDDYHLQESTADQDDDEFGDFEESSTSPPANTTKEEKELGNRRRKEGLGSLVQSELPSLSKYWLLALKDHALLSLPSEFKSQLPFDGGAFYTNDTIILARPHYRTTWPPILHAAAIWLSYGEALDQDENVFTIEEEDVNEKKKSKTTEELKADHFHLLLGVCIEGLANTRSADLSKDQVMYCLRTLLALLDHQWVRRYLAAQQDQGTSKTLLVELCNVLHRTVLTRETVAIQSLALDVLRLVLITAKHVLEVARKTKSRELGVPANRVPVDDQATVDALNILGEGGSDGVLVPGSSVSFSALEVCLCVLVRHYPELSPRAANLTSAAALRARAGLHRSLQGHGDLVTAAVEILARLPGLCSPKGSLAVLPSILWLLIGVIKSTGDGEDASGAVHSLQYLLQQKIHASEEKSGNKWTSLLQSALQRLLDLAKTSDGDSNSDINVLMAIAVFFLHSPSTVMNEAPGLKYPAVNAFVRAFQQQTLNDPASRRKVVQAVSSVLKETDRSLAQPLAQGKAKNIHHSVRFVNLLCSISAMAAPVLDFLLVDETSRSAKSEAEVALTLECVNLVDVLTTSPNLAPLSGGDKRVGQLHLFLIPILVSHLLVPEEIKEASALRVVLHDQAYNKLLLIGRTWPAQFTSVIGQNEVLRGRLEAADRVFKERQKSSSTKPKDRETTGKPNQSAATIALTMDFSKKYVEKINK